MSTNNSINLGVVAGSGNTFTFPASSDTLVGRATTDTLTNKTISGSSNTLSNISLTSSVTGTLPVGSGGTGATTLTGVIIGNGTSAFTVKTNPTGAFVGTSDTQTLTNKTLDNTSTVTLKQSLFTLQDATDTTKQSQFVLSGISTSTTRSYTLPNASDTVAVLGLAQTFQNKTHDNTNTFTTKAGSFTLQDGTDTTKQANFVLSSITTGNTRSYTLPDTSDTIVTLGATQTLTSKTLTSPKVNQINDTNGNEALGITATASAVDYVNITNSIAGSPGTVVINAAGSDSNIILNIKSKGTGIVEVDGAMARVFPTLPKTWASTVGAWIYPNTSGSPAASAQSEFQSYSFDTLKPQYFWVSDGTTAANNFMSTGTPPAAGTLMYLFQSVNVYTFTITAASATAGATYTNNGVTFTVLTTISSGTTLTCSATSAPTASGTLTKASGTGGATITFSAFATYSTTTTCAANGYTSSNYSAITSASTHQYITLAGNYTSLTALLGSATLQTNLQNKVLDFFNVTLGGTVTGLEIDFEPDFQWTETDASNFTTFIQNLGTALHNDSHHYKLMADWQPMGYQYPSQTQNPYFDVNGGSTLLEWTNYPNASYQMLGTLVSGGYLDYVVVDAYDEMFNFADGMAVQPLEWMKSCIFYAQMFIPNANLIAGIPSYGYYGTMFPVPTTTTLASAMNGTTFTTIASFPSTITVPSGGTTGFTSGEAYVAYSYTKSGKTRHGMMPFTYTGTTSTAFTGCVPYINNVTETTGTIASTFVTDSWPLQGANISAGTTKTFSTGGWVVQYDYNNYATADNVPYQTMSARSGFSTAVRDPISGEMSFATTSGSQTTVNYFNDSTSLAVKRAVAESMGVIAVHVFSLGGNPLLPY